MSRDHTIALHSSLGNKSETLSQKKKNSSIIDVFRLLTFNAVIDMFGLRSTILLFVFCFFLSVFHTSVFPFSSLGLFENFKYSILIALVNFDSFWHLFYLFLKEEKIHLLKLLLIWFSA